MSDANTNSADIRYPLDECKPCDDLMPLDEQLINIFR